MVSINHESRSAAGRPSARIGRWRIVAALLAPLTIGVVGIQVAGPGAGAATNPITVENAKAGNPIPALDGATAGQIQGYAAAQSINVGQQLPLHVSSQLGNVDLHVYRLGSYGGANARQVLLASNVAAAARTTPAPDSFGTVVANWPLTYTIATDATWTSGAYVVALHKAGAAAPSGFIPFVVRNDAATSAFLYVVPLNTYQAYNAWGGKSLYGFNSSSGVPAVKVSFDRPYDSESGAGFLFEGDAYMVQFLEREGYDVSYAASADLETSSLLGNHRAFLSSFHDEYWTLGARTTLENAIAAGKHAAFFGANSVYWQVRFEAAADGRPFRTMVGYKDSVDPVQGPTTTTRWRQAPVNRPENALLGSMYEGDFAYGNSAPWVVANASHWIYNGTGLANGDQIPKLVGYEWDRVFDNGFTPTGLVTLSDSTPQPGARQQATIYQRGGALVFNASSIYWPLLLSNPGWGIDARVQQMTRNVLNAMIDPNGPPATTAPPTTTTTLPPNETVLKAWDFEDGTAQGWGVWYGDGVASVSSVGTHGGTYALKVTTGTGYATAAVPYSGLVPGQTYTIRGWLRNDTPTFNLGLVQFYTATGSAGPDVEMLFTPDASGVWSQFAATFVLPPATTAIYIGVNGGQSVMTMDDVRISTPSSGVTTTTAPATTTTVPGSTTTLPVTTVPGSTTTTVPGSTTTTVAPTNGCSVKYTIGWDNGVGFGAQVSVTNFGGDTNGWTLVWTFAGNQTIDPSGAWGGTATQSAKTVTFRNAPWNGVIGGGARADVGFNGVYSGANAVPTAYALNGVACAVEGLPPTTTTTVPATTTTTVPATTTTTTRPPTTTTTTTTTTTRPPTTTTTTTTTTTRPPTTTTTTTRPPTTTTTTTTIPAGTVVARWLFDDGRTTGWSASGGSLSLSTSARTGTRSLRASGGTATVSLSSAVSSGRTYTFRAWVKPTNAVTPTGVAVISQFFSTTRVNATVGAPVNGWYPVTVKFTTPSLLTGASVQLSARSGSFLIDDVDLTRT